MYIDKHITSSKHQVRYALACVMLVYNHTYVFVLTNFYKLDNLSILSGEVGGGDFVFLNFSIVLHENSGSSAFA